MATLPPAHVPFPLFEALFRGAVRVRLDWDLLSASQSDVQVFEPQPQQLLEFVCPWYVGSDGAEVPVDSPDGTPVTVRRATTLHGARTARIRTLAAGFTDGPQSPIIVATFAVPGGRQLVLDGAHRLTAVALGGCRVPVAVFCVEAAATTDLLPDLRHFVE